MNMIQEMKTTQLHIDPETDASKHERLKGKTAFEQVAERLGVKVTHYHAKNGRFTDNNFYRRPESIRANDYILWGKCSPSELQGEKRIRDL